MKHILKALVVVCLTLFLPLLCPVSAMDRNDPGQKAEMQIVGDLLTNSDEPLDWVTVCRAVFLLGEKNDENSKRLLAAVLKQETPPKLLEGSRLPGVMSPLDMLKAAALDALGKLKAHEYLGDMEEVYQKAGNATLRRIAKENIEALAGSSGK
jgi:hypothetical protein